MEAKGGEQARELLDEVIAFVIEVGKKHGANADFEQFGPTLLGIDDPKDAKGFVEMVSDEIPKWLAQWGIKPVPATLLVGVCLGRAAERRDRPSHTPNGYDPCWVEAINAVLRDRETGVSITDVDDTLWDNYIGPMIDGIEGELKG